MTTQSEPNSTDLVKQVDDWGYYLLPQAHPHSPGHTGLLVAIRETLTRMHFDPESMSLQIVDEDGLPIWATFHLTWHPPRSCRVCLTRVILRAQSGKMVEFFTFGGTLESTSGPGERVYSLRSPAPILELVEQEEKIPDVLAFETEALIARLQARWGADEVGFDRRLAQTDPLRLYVASIHSILTHHTQMLSLHERIEFHEVLLAEKHWLEKTQQWPATPPTLEQLLAP